MVKEQDERSNHLRELFSSFYGSGSSNSESQSDPSNALQEIDLPNFDSDHFISSLLVKTPFGRLRDRHVEMAAEIKALDSDIQLLVYENYNKFISATDTIRRMKENVSGMELEMDQLLKMVTVVRGESDGINASLCKRRERIEELNRTQSLLRQIQFVFSLPHRLRKCISTENYVEAAKYYNGSLPILKAYGQTSFRKCKKESDAMISTLIKKLRAKVGDRTVLLPARAQAVSLLQQLNHPELEVLTSQKDLRAEDERDFIQRFLDEAVEFRKIFSNSEDHLLHISTEFFDEYFKTVNLSLQLDDGDMLAAEMNMSFRQLFLDVSKMNEFFPGANLLARASEAVENAVRNHVKKQFNSLYSRIEASISVRDLARKSDSQQPPKTLKAFLEIAQKTIIDGSLEVLQDLKELLDKSKSYFARWADEYTDLVQGGVQELFTKLVDHFRFLCVRSVETLSQSDELQSTQTVSPSLILILSLLSIYLSQTAVPQITELVGTWFPGGGAMGSEGRPAFIPSEICRFLNTTGEKLLQQYVDVRAVKCSVVVRKAVNTPNWLEYKEPSGVRSFTDLLLQEVGKIQADVQQLLPLGPTRAYRHKVTSGSTGPSQSDSVRHDGPRAASNLPNVRNQFSERELTQPLTGKAKIFTKVEYNQLWVISSVIKMTLKTYEESVRLQTYHRGGYQQTQLDCHYLREPLQNLVDDPTAVDFMLDEVCSAASERCQDPVPLDTAALDRFVQAKKAETESAVEEAPSRIGN